VNALANTQVGAYLDEHFVATVVKVGTFTLNNGQKQGGNVASYFCTADGSVIHAIAGPVDAQTMLREAQWVVSTRTLAMFEGRGNQARYREVIRKAHAERLQSEYGVDMRQLYAAAAGYATGPFVPSMTVQWDHGVPIRGRVAGGANSANQYKVHMLLFGYPLVKVDTIYKYVFEKILNEKISTLPVAQK
jgi:hypothetical protein